MNVNSSRSHTIFRMVTTLHFKISAMKHVLIGDYRLNICFKASTLGFFMPIYLTCYYFLTFGFSEGLEEVMVS